MVVFADRIEQFCNRLHAMYNDHYAARGYTFAPPTFTAEHGRKYVRIVMADSQRSVYCFVENGTGTILKAAGWKTPAKGPRGSIWHDNCDVGDDKPCNMHGSNLYR